MVQVLLRVAAALVTKMSNTGRAAPSAAMLTDCAAMGATPPVQFATWCAANAPHHGQLSKGGWPAAVLIDGSAHTNARPRVHHCRLRSQAGGFACGLHTSAGYDLKLRFPP